MKDNNINQKIGERIKARRTELEMTQEDLAKLLGLKNRSTVTRYEKGEKTFKPSQLIALSKALKIDIETLQGGVKTMQCDEYQKIWNAEMSGYTLTEAEIHELIRYAKYLISQRGELNE